MLSNNSDGVRIVSNAGFAASSAKSPPRFLPNRKSSPTIKNFTPKSRTKTFSTNSSAGADAKPSPKRTPHTASRHPVARKSAILSRAGVSLKGMGAPRRLAKNSCGCGSKIIATAGRPKASARSRRRLSTRRCPKCTPSKLPMVKAQPPGKRGRLTLLI